MLKELEGDCYDWGKEVEPPCRICSFLIPFQISKGQGLWAPLERRNEACGGNQLFSSCGNSSLSSLPSPEPSSAFHQATQHGIGRLNGAFFKL